MPITPDLPFPKSAGDAIRSKDWNDLVVETQRLDNAKVNRAGDAITGSLTIDGQIGIGTRTPTAPLTVQNAAGAFVSTRGVNGSVELQVGADSSGAVVSAITNHDLRLFSGGNNLKAVVRTDGTLQVLGSASVGPFVLPAVPGSLMVTGSVAEIGFARRNLASWPAARFRAIGMSGTTPMDRRGSGQKRGAIS